jgi:predicted regulator of Ras-like GTPase activity (Roadblock/LC7/MglB family)
VLLLKINSQALIERMEEMRRAAPDIEAAAVVSLDGLIMASALPEGFSEDRVAAMSAAMLSLGEQISKEMSRGALEQLYTRGTAGYVVLLAIGTEAVLTTLIKPEAKLGILFLEMRRTADDLLKIITEPNLEAQNDKRALLP